MCPTKGYNWIIDVLNDTRELLRVAPLESFEWGWLNATYRLAFAGIHNDLKEQSLAKTLLLLVKHIWNYKRLLSSLFMKHLVLAECIPNADLYHMAVFQASFNYVTHPTITSQWEQETFLVNCNACVWAFQQKGMFLRVYLLEVMFSAFWLPERKKWREHQVFEWCNDICCITDTFKRSQAFSYWQCNPK